MLQVAQRGGLQAILDNPVEFVKASTPFGHKSAYQSPTTAATSLENASQIVVEKKALSNPRDGVEIKRPNKVLFPENNLARSWQKVMANPPGLHNTGNTCFLNSVMQALMHVPGLVIFLLSGTHSQDCRLNNCVFCKLEDHARKAYPGNGNKRGSPFRPVYAQSLKQIGKQFRPGRQEDAHEFLILLLEQLQISSLQGQPKTLDQRSKETTVVHRLFGGHLRQQIVCFRCKEPSNTYEATLVLSIDCLANVEQGLSRLTAAESLTGRNKYKCERCKMLQEARKQTTIYDAPENLILHLKRFQFASKSTKLTKPVSFDQKLDLRKYMAPGRSSGYYTLAGVLVHQGSGANNGHYFTFCRGSHGTWNEFNDSSVSQSGLERVLKQQAYLLFYTRDSNAEQLVRQTVASNSTSSAARESEQLGSALNFVPKDFSDSSPRGKKKTFEELTMGDFKEKRKFSGMDTTHNKKHRIFSQMRGKR